MHSLSVPTVSKIEKGNSQSIIILRWKENRALFVALINLADSESIISYAKNGTGRWWWWMRCPAAEQQLIAHWPLKNAS